MIWFHGHIHFWLGRPQGITAPGGVNGQVLLAHAVQHTKQHPEQTTFRELKPIIDKVPQVLAFGQ